MARYRAEEQPSSLRSCWTCHRRRILFAVAACLLAVAGVLEFGFEVRIPWLAMIFWVLAGVAVIVAASGLGGGAVDRF